MASKKATKRELTVLVRYEILKDYAPKGLHAGDIVILVRNDQNKEYYVTLRARTKVHSCTCPSRKRCYHVSTLVELENTRFAAHKAAKAVQPVVSKPVQPVASPVVAEESYTMSSALLAKLAGKPAEPVKDNVVDIAERGALNSSQQSASFWLALPSRQIA